MILDKIKPETKVKQLFLTSSHQFSHLGTGERISVEMSVDMSLQHMSQLIRENWQGPRSDYTSLSFFLKLASFKLEKPRKQLKPQQMLAAALQKKTRKKLECMHGVKRLETPDRNHGDFPMHCQHWWYQLFLSYSAPVLTQPRTKHLATSIIVFAKKLTSLQECQNG